MDFTTIESQKPVIVVSADDLETAFRTILLEVLKEKEEAEKEANISRKAVRERLGVDNSTLWRWDKTGYLRAYHRGRAVFYHESDVKRLEEGILL
jgi:hypothetical protein